MRIFDSVIAPDNDQCDFEDMESDTWTKFLLICGTLYAVRQEVILKLESVQLRKHCISKAERHRATRSGFFWVFWFENIVFGRLVYFRLATIRRHVAVETPTARVK